jgi:hypothetical protein
MMGPWAWPVLNMQSDPYDRDSVLRAKCSVLSAKSEILGSVLHGVHQFLTKHSALSTEHRAPSTPPKVARTEHCALCFRTEHRALSTEFMTEHLFYV